MAAQTKEDIMGLILSHLSSPPHSLDSSLSFCSSQPFSHEEFVGALKSLESINFVVSKTHSLESWVLSKEAEQVVKNGSPEILFLRACTSDAPLKTKGDLEKELGAETVKFGWGVAMKGKWIQFDKKSGEVKRLKAENEVEDTAKNLLVKLQGGASLNKKDIDALKRRKFISQEKKTYFSVEKGPSFSLTLPKSAADFTTELFLSGEWEKTQMKPFNLNALGANASRGHLHPLQKVRAEYRQIFLEMGFQEMTTNRYVENSFWNFDTLFQPQQHPARDAHDTFFVSSPAESKLPGDGYVQRVKDMHEKGDGDSLGWRYDWSEEETRKNILRTHTTAVSSRTLYELAQEDFKPGKYFSVDKVYRNEAMDATHLAEFHQVEGFVVDRGLTLGNLIGVIRDFFNYLGITKLKFKPAYNPYTEPSMEIFSYHEGLKKWVEIGNSGIFRPEMLKPMGFPDDVSVIAW
eukprot:CAMPEP_0201524782 /NCGR_PEP_ID=MMETSP0161_2-20130828/25143_1 /ASSEMBLY_ACC=CAM_ASM_000251 /TAXON_ID=180227 /ORGANISM="Neoparamoeba aestuarina, Strain SoJaBio B1-5/56/2" /LENGTH=461 /DNA_ID=CAMNT_0047924363 /DNA_START=96 /DNA_END=1478 /DNA_ORIENTATION=-